MNYSGQEGGWCLECEEWFPSDVVQDYEEDEGSYETEWDEERHKYR